MYYEHAIATTTHLAVEILKTIVPSSAERLDSIQTAISTAVLERDLVKSRTAELERIERLHDSMTDLAYCIDQASEETQTLVENSIVRTIFAELETWRGKVAQAKNAMFEALAEKAIVAYYA